MALPVQTLNVSLAGGMNEKTPRELLPPGQNALVQNGRWLQPGQVETRLGYTTLTTDRSGGGSVTTAAVERLFTRNDELVYLNDQGINSYSPPSMKWIRRDDVPEPHLDVNRVSSAHANDAFVCADMAINASGVQCVAWRNFKDTATFTAGLFDVNGQLIAREKFTDGSFPRVLLVGSIFVVVYMDLTAPGRTIRARTIDPSNPGAGFSASTALLTDAQGSPNWDCAAGPTHFFVAYEATSLELTIRRYSTALSNTHTTALAASNVREVAIHADSTHVFTAFHNQGASNTNVMRRDQATLATDHWEVTAITGVTGALLTVGAHSDSAYIWLARSGSQPEQVEWRRLRKSDGSLLAEASKITFNCQIASKVFSVPGSGEAFIAVRVARNIETQDGLVCCALGEGNEALADYKLRPVAKWLNGKLWWQEFGGTPINYLPQGAVQFNSVFLAHTEKNFQGTRGSYVTVSKLDFGAANRWARQEDRDTVMVAGGMLHEFDGDLLSEIPFAYYPYVATPTVQAGGSLTIGTNGIYEYRVCYEWTDARGRIHRSTPSDILTAPAVSAGNQTVRLIIPYLTLTSRCDVNSSFRSPLAIAIYRRGPDASAATSFVRLISTGTTQLAGTLPLNDMLGTAGLTFNDNGTAWTTTGEPVIYTDGGVLENVPVSSCKVVAKWDNRIWVGGCENPNSIWYSRELVADEPPLWHENQQILCEEKVTALANFDSALIVFSRDSIYAMQGTGPNDLGQGNTYTGLIKLASEIGCADWRSMTVTADGIFFQHRPGSGIYLLDRSLSLTYIGAPVENMATVTYPTVTSCVAVPDEDEVRFSVTNGSTGRLLVYNTLIKQWMVHKLFDSLELDPRDAVLWAGAYLFARGGYFGQQSATYRDYHLPTATQYRIPLEVETGDISIDGPLGRDRQWRILLFARRNASNSHGLEVSMAYDQSDTFADTKTWTAAEIAALASTTHEALEIVAKSRQEARAIRVRVRTLAGTGGTINEFVKLMALGFEFGKEEGLTVLPAAQKR